MSAPRCVKPGVTYQMNRRTTRRFFLFRPDEDREMQGLFWYCLAIAAAKHGIVIHNAVLMSTHLHIVFTDVRGVLPQFLHEFHRLLALATKCHRGWSEEVFNKAQTTCVAIETDELLVQELAYVTVNPVAGGAVRYAKEWPGARVLPSEIGRRVIHARRPRVYFDPSNPKWPEVIELHITMPESLVDRFGGEDEAREAIAAEVRHQERRAWEDLEKEGRRFMGAKRAKRVPITRRSQTPDRFGGPVPQFAVGDDPELEAEALERLRTFRHEYREALERWRAGERDVVFPYGTWWMRIRYNVNCHPAPN